MTYVMAMLCVVGITAGQVLFKLSANSLHQAGTLLHIGTLLLLLASFALYGLTTIGWVWLLQNVELGRVYPIMALSFALVPLASHFVFGEQFGARYFAGVALIVFGIVVAVRS
jgi:drug/metabolite transporter (DMT)-like permease